MRTDNRKTNAWMMVPVFGIGAFVLLYVAAAWLYPGGSQADKTANGFSWLQNYWCDLLDGTAKNGTTNGGRSVAIVAWFTLCLSLALFWYFLPLLFGAYTRLKTTARCGGVAAMLVAIPLFSPLHDWVIQVAGFFGLLAFVATFIGLFKSKYYGFFYSGLFCGMLMVLNYAIMMSGIYSEYLPLIQKITFGIVLIWILAVNNELIRHYRKHIG